MTFRFLSRFSSLRYTLAAALVLGLVGPSWLALENEKNEVHQRLSTELAADRERYGDLLLQALREPVWHLSPEFAAPVVDTLMRDGRVTKISVTLLPDHRVFVERAAPGVVKPPIVATVRAIQTQGKDVAHIKLEMSAANILERVADAEYRFYWRTGSSLVAALTLIFLAFYFRVMRPVERLVSQASALAGNRLNEPFDWRRLDEIGRVGRSLEDTRLALGRMFGELERVNSDLVQENEERRKAESLLAEHAAELEDRVLMRTKALSESNADLLATMGTLKTAQRELVESEKLASLGRLVAGVAHELNTPVGNALMVGSTLGHNVKELGEVIESGQLKKAVLSKFLKESAEACVLLERSLGQAAQLVTSFKQVAVDQTTAQRRKFDLAIVVQEILATLQPRFKKTPFKLDVHTEPDILLDSYPGQLGQVISNIVINAELHGFDGRDSGTIRIETHDLGDSVRLVIQDNGNGIPQAIQGKVFDPFFTTKMGTGGTGLGLNIVHGLVSRVLGGRITLESTETVGTSFILELPKTAPLVVDELVDAL